MRKQQKTMLWPVYFDSSKTRREGRKVPKTVAVPNPNLTELQQAANHLGLKPDVEADSVYPAFPWRKTGRIWVQKKGSKLETMTKIGREIAATRQRTKK